MPAARHPALSVPCGAGLLPLDAGALARLGMGSRWHGEAGVGCWQAAAGVCACKGALDFLLRLADLLHPQLCPDQRHNRLRGMHNVYDYTPLWLLQGRELACQQSWRHKVTSTLRQPLVNEVIISL